MREFRMPSLGADMEEGTIVEWLVQPGDRVQRGAIVAVVETEKSDLDIEVFDDGVVDELVVPVGRKVPVGTVLALLLPADAAPVAIVEPPPLAVHAEEHPPHVLSPMIRRLAEDLHVDLTEVHPTDAFGRVHRDDVERAAEHRAAPPPAASAHGAYQASPRARRLARERAIDLSGLTGTGPYGNVVGADVLGAPTRLPVNVAAAARPERLLKRRRAIGALMTKSWQTIPQYHLRQRISMERALTWLDHHNAEASAESRILPAALLMRAVAVAAARSKAVNGFWVDDHFEPAEHVNLGVAVALRDGGLLTPSLANADQLTLAELMAELRQLVTRARTGHLRASDTTGATITTTNLGDVGVDEVTGVIFPPQVAIVGFGAVRDEPWVTDGALGVHRVVHATLAADHRVSDGRVGGLFLAGIDQLLQEPEAL